VSSEACASPARITLRVRWIAASGPCYGNTAAPRLRLQFGQEAAGLWLNGRFLVLPSSEAPIVHAFP
jgi:hypothetical protein